MKQYSPTEKERVISLVRGGLSMRAAATKVGVSRQTVSRWIKESGEDIAKQPGGRPRALMSRDDNLIRRLATTGKCQTATAIASHFQSYCGIEAHRKTFARTLKRFKLGAFRKRCRSFLKWH